MAEVNDHSIRAHATWSASSTTRNWNCPGALALTEQVAGLDKESEAAAWGTSCHSVAEWCLNNGTDAEEMIDRTVKTKEHEFTVDEEMAETAQTYVDYVRNQQAGVNDLFVEQRFSLEKLKTPFDAGGTADAVVYIASEKLLEVIDLKGGRGVKVEVNENKQLRTYALGALLSNPGLDVRLVRSTIVQPRAYHKDGAIRSEDYHVADLLSWTGELMQAMNRSKTAVDAYATITGDLTREKWADEYLSAGDHCTFCPAAGFCPALQKKATDAVGLYFDDLSQPQLSNTPDSLSPEKLAAVLDAADLIQNYITACRSLAHSMAETGIDIPNYQLVDKTGRRRWKIEDETALAGEIQKLTTLDENSIFKTVKKILSPAQLEKVLKKDKEKVKSLIETPITGTNLVRSDKTTRPAATPSVNKFFEAC